MSRDLLDEATRALRDGTAGDDGGAGFTRARVMASLHQGRVRRRTRMALLLPIAATLAAASAWGVGSESGREVVRQVGERLGLFESRSQELELRTRKPPAPPVGPRKPEAVVPETPPPSPNETPAPAPPSEVSARPAAPSAAAVNAAEERELTLYRAAHRAHFVERDFAAALSGWSEYLSKVPGGRFSLEARYNRALCLVQLGRKSEAKTALEPFARGTFSGYRQREASELLGALGE